MSREEKLAELVVKIRAATPMWWIQCLDCHFRGAGRWVSPGVMCYECGGSNTAKGKVPQAYLLVDEGVEEPYDMRTSGINGCWLFPPPRYLWVRTTEDEEVLP